MEEFKKMLAAIEDAKFDHDKFFDRGNKAAGVRLRAAMQEIKALAQAVRVKVTETKAT